MNLNSINYNVNEMYEIYTDIENTHKFTVGYIVTKDEKFVLCESIDPYGEKDGLVLFLCDNIFKIQYNTNYVKNIKKLYNQKGNERKNVFPTNIDNLLMQLLEYIVKNKKICTIELCDSNTNDNIGFLQKIDIESDTIELNIINDDGNHDGVSIIDLNMISSITVDSLDDKKIYALTNMKA